jgi:F-type H+-transporting ATPase subunit b
MHPISRFALSAYATGLAIFWFIAHRNNLPGIAMTLLANPEFWVAVGFVAVVGVLLWQRVPAMVGTMLDARAAAIRAELDEAKRLREEAAKLLADYRLKAAAAEREAESIVAEAKAESDRFAAEQRQHLRTQIERRTKLAQDKIAQAETQAMNEIRAMAADIATAAAEKLIAARLDEKRAATLVEKSIQDLPGKLN